MQEYFYEVKKTVAQVILFVGFIALGAYLEGRKAVALGLVIGAVTGITYYLLMSYRIKKAAGLSIAKAVFSMKVGWFIRFIFVLLMFLLCMRLPFVDIWAAVVGIFSLHIIILFNAVAGLFKAGGK
jgi:hypothetical protein